MSGAIDFDECPSRSRRGYCTCEPVCSVCGYRKHTAIHGPHLDQPPGSEPWGHEFLPKDASPTPTKPPQSGSEEE